MKNAFEFGHGGIHLTFKNGWTVSIQIGAGTYSDNKSAFTDMTMEEISKKRVWYSNTAEIWSWNSERNYPEDPLGIQSIEDVMKFIAKVRRFKKVNDGS